ncbi:MAG: biotin--[acetyl-CoA-carboxylase] ligase [Acholeplasmataceae bacterium]|nr:biotin--[acetyl-CoA-carboxylase] ligase [Acholeplasmataceae bacterium]
MRFTKQIHFSVLSSTNTYLKDNYRSLPNYTVVSADRQTAGRGRFQRTWIDGEDLLLSILLKDDLPTVNIFGLSLVTAAAVHSSLSEIAAPVIKWPNDIILNNKKIAGILIESIICNNRPECLVIGIGVNVNTENYPEDLCEKATSLAIENGKKYSIQELQEKVLEEFSYFYDDFLHGGNLAFLVCRKYSSLIGKEVEINDFKDRQKGVVLDILPNGNILLWLKSGNQEFHSGEITLNANY